MRGGHQKPQLGHRNMPPSRWAVSLVYWTSWHWTDVLFLTGRSKVSSFAWGHWIKEIWVGNIETHSLILKNLSSSPMIFFLGSLKPTFLSPFISANQFQNSIECRQFLLVLLSFIFCLKFRAMGFFHQKKPQALFTLLGDTDNLTLIWGVFGPT